MHYISEYRDKDKALALSEAIGKLAESHKIYRFMEFCGGHTHVLSRWGFAAFAAPC